MVIRTSEDEHASVLRLKKRCAMNPFCQGSAGQQPTVRSILVVTKYVRRPQECSSWRPGAARLSDTDDVGNYVLVNIEPYMEVFDICY